MSQPIRYAKFKFPVHLAIQLVQDRIRASGVNRSITYDYLKETLDLHCHYLADLPGRGYLFFGPGSEVSMLYVLPD